MLSKLESCQEWSLYYMREFVINHLMKQITVILIQTG